MDFALEVSAFLHCLMGSATRRPVDLLKRSAALQAV